MRHANKAKHRNSRPQAKLKFRKLLLEKNLRLSKNNNNNNLIEKKNPYLIESYN